MLGGSERWSLFAEHKDRWNESCRPEGVVHAFHSELEEECWVFLGVIVD